jgi:hypothetical protein
MIGDEPPMWCPYHYERRRHRRMTEDQEYAFFEEWCQAGRWPLCAENPSLLWKILCGVASAKAAPPESFATMTRPYHSVIEATMSLDQYWGHRKPPSQCTPQEMIALYGPSPCDRPRTVTGKELQDILARHVSPPEDELEPLL